MYIFLARLYSMISEYYQESTVLSDHSDFYHSLYNKSRIKPSSICFPTKNKNSLADIFAKDTLSQRSKNVPLNKDKHNNEMTEEQQIINWLASYDDNSDNNVKFDKKNACNDKTKSNLKEANSVIESLHIEKHFVNDIVGENKNQEDKVLYQLSKSVNSSSLKESITQHSVDTSKNIKPEFSLESSELNNSESIKILKDCSVSESHKQKLFLRKSSQRKISDDRDTSKKIKPELSLESSELNGNEPIKILKDYLFPESHKHKSPPRKSGQTKISDFFQRVS